jgi:hypothetical protein
MARYMKQMVHDQINFFDLDMTLQRMRTRKGTTVRMLLQSYRTRQAGQCLCLHALLRRWLLAPNLAELLKLFTHSSKPKLWKEESSILYHNLCSRGSHGVSTGQSFTSSHGHGGLSYSREVARRKATSFSRPIGPVSSYSESARHRSGQR